MIGIAVRAICWLKNSTSVHLNAVQFAFLIRMRLGSQQTLSHTLQLARSPWDISGSQLPQLSMLHQTSMDVSFGGSTIPLFLVFIRYTPILNIVCLCIDHGLAANLVH
jgi:hypothetical protein